MASEAKGYTLIHKKATDEISELRKELNLVLSDNNLYFYQIFVNKQLFCMVYGVVAEGNLIYSVKFNDECKSKIAKTRLEVVLCNFITKVIAESKARGIKTSIEFQFDLENESEIFDNFTFLQLPPMNLKNLESNTRVLHTG
jgi:hypothetical protein